MSPLLPLLHPRVTRWWLALQRQLRAVFLLAAAALVIHNALQFFENQRTLPCHQKLCKKSGTFYKIAAKQANWRLRSMANFLLLRKRIPLASLTVPPRMAPDQWLLEHLSRLRVQVSPEPLLIDRRHIKALVQKSSESSRWLWTPAKEKRPAAFRDVHYLFDDTSTEYVMGETEDSGKTKRTFFVVPAVVYAQVAAR